jgi:hypothetical protein
MEGKEEGGKADGKLLGGLSVGRQPGQHNKAKEIPRWLQI